MVKDEVKKRVMKKLDLAGDLRGSKIRTSMGHTEMVDGKLQTSFQIDGLPRKNNKGDNSLVYSERSYESIPKIFNSWDELSEYAKSFFSKTDEELIEMCKNKKY